MAAVFVIPRVGILDPQGVVVAQFGVQFTSEDPSLAPNQSWNVMKHALATKRSLDGGLDIAVNASVKVWAQGPAVGLQLAADGVDFLEGENEMDAHDANLFLQAINDFPYLSLIPWNLDRPLEGERMILIPSPEVVRRP